MNAFRSGQSLIELLIAMAVGMIFMTGISVIVISSLGESTQAARIQTSATNAENLMNNVRVWSEGGWSNISSLATGSAYEYYLITSSSPYTATSGIESIVIGSTTYTRYFYLSDVYRTASLPGTITSATSGVTYDPSTIEVSVVYGWANGPTNTMNTYLTRNHDQAIEQTDWSGGPNATGVATSVSNQFTSSSNINYSSTTGAFSILTL